MSNKLALFATILSLLFVTGCNETPQNNVSIQAAGIMDATDLDLEAVASVIRSGSIRNGQELQDFINRTEGVNNVDIDRDGSVDEITVREERIGGTDTVMAITAHPMQGEETVVAEVNFENVGGQVRVDASYPSYVNGYHDYHYRYSVARDLAFIAWAYDMGRPVYVPRYHRGLYYTTPRARLSPQRVSSTRSTLRKTSTHVSPVKKSVRPSNYKSSSSAAKKVASTRKPATGSKLSSSGQKASAIKKQTASKSTKATGFGAKKPSTSSASKPSVSSAPRPTVSKPRPTVSKPRPRPSFSKPRPRPRPSFSSKRRR